MQRCGQLAGALLAVVLAVTGARAQDETRRVALVDPGVELERAVRAALEPWGVEVLVIAGPSPGATAPASNEAAERMASEQRVGALVWVSEHDGGHALWVYDRDTHHEVERALAQAPPFDAAAAAALALSIKTLLRHSAAAPPGERYGAAAGVAEGSGQAAITKTRMTTTTTTTHDHDADHDRDHPIVEAEAPAAITSTTRDHAAAFPPDPTAKMVHAAPSWLDLALAGGARLLATEPHAVEPRAELAASFWPERGAIGVRAGVAAGLPLTIDDRAFEGELVDLAVRCAFALRRDFAPRLRGSAALVGALHVLVLDGTLPQSGAAASETRVAPALALAVQADWALSARLRVGLWTELAYLLRAERYLVEQRAVFELGHLGLSAGAALSVGWVD